MAKSAVNINEVYNEITWKINSDNTYYCVKNYEYLIFTKHWRSDKKFSKQRSVINTYIYLLDSMNSKDEVTFSSLFVICNFHILLNFEFYSS
jgi:hypothetical protein